MIDHNTYNVAIQCVIRTMAQGYECDRCGGLNSGEPHSRIELGDGVPRRRPRGYERGMEEGAPIHDEGTTYDICPGCRSEFDAWFEDE